MKEGSLSGTEDTHGVGAGGRQKPRGRASWQEGGDKGCRGPRRAGSHLHCLSPVLAQVFLKQKVDGPRLSPWNLLPVDR